MCVINVSLMATLVYETKFSTWTLAQYQELDILFEKAYRSITLNQASFPTRLIYAPKEQLGLGCHKYSSLVQEAKLHMWQRSSYGGNDTRKFIINSLTGRVLRQMGCQPTRNGNYCLHMLEKNQLPVDVRDSWWYTSLAEHMQLVHVTLERRIHEDQNVSHFTPEYAPLLWYPWGSFRSLPTFLI